MANISFMRSIAVVLASLLLVAFIDQTLVLSIIIVTHAFATLLTGYVLARLAGSYEVQHAAVAGVFVMLLLIGASASPNVMVPPVWVRLTMAAVTLPAMITGAYIRGQARLLRDAQT